MKYAILKHNVVVNVIEYAEEPSTPPAGFEDGYIAVQADVVSPGWHYANGAFTNPNPPVIVDMPAPKSLTDMILESPTELAKIKKALGLA
jgi:hypothetical protein